MTNTYIAQQRAQFAFELADPALVDEVCAMMVTEDAAHPVPCLESLFNRILYCRSHGQNRSVLAMLHGGFYGPYNRGQYPRTIRELHANPKLQATMKAAIATVFAGSNLIQGFNAGNNKDKPAHPSLQRPANHTA